MLFYSVVYSIGKLNIRVELNRKKKIKVTHLLEVELLVSGRII
jgi:hypothetical protein